MKLKKSCYNHDYNWSVWFCCHNTLGLVLTVCPLPRPNSLGIGLPVRTCPCALWQQTPPEPVFIPLSTSCEISLRWMLQNPIDDKSTSVQVMASQIPVSMVAPSQCWSKHDDVIKWKHFPRYWPFVRGIHRSPVNSPHKGQWRGALMFTLICVWINGCVNNREAGDLRRYCSHYGVTVMI